MNLSSLISAKFPLRLGIATAATLWLTTAFGFTQTTLIDVSFPEGLGINPTFTEIDNGVGTTNSWSQSTGVLTTSTNANSTAGAVSGAVLDFTALGSEAFVLEISVAAATFNELNANGMFVGFQDSNDPTGAGLWNNHSPSFGLWIGGGAGGVPVREVGGGGNAGVGRTQESSYGVATAASLQDGFDVTIIIESDGWSIELDGLIDAAGKAITGGSETWAESTQGFAFTSFTADMHVAMSVQTPLDDAGTVTLSRIKLTQGFPGSGAGFQILDIAFGDVELDPTTTVTWASEANARYSVDYSTDLTSWSEVQDGVASGGDVTEFAHQLLPDFSELVGADRVYYRIRLGQ